MVARRQLLDSGLAPHDVRRQLRRRTWTAVHPGVYVDHTGPLSWEQRAWAAVLWAWPAALCDLSALRTKDDRAALPTTRADQLLHVAVDRHRSTLVTPRGVQVHHVQDLTGRVQWNASPPRLRHDEAVIDLAARLGDLDAVAVLAQACGSRRTTPGRLLAVLEGRSRVPRRTWLRDVLRDLAEGTCSVLEHGYLERVERPHGLPRADRQRRETGSTKAVYRDAAYGDEALVELDGRTFHTDPADRDADLERDLDAACTGAATVRLGWGQVFGRPCTTALKVGAFLAARGIIVSPRGCRPGCAVGARETA